MINSRKIISILSAFAGFLILSMFVVTLVTGVSQEKFEVTQTVESYTRNLLEANGILRLYFTIDLIFICIFTTLFVILPQYLKTGEKVSDAIARLYFFCIKFFFKLTID